MSCNLESVTRKAYIHVYINVLFQIKILSVAN
jgi:hypothetical protein